MDDMTSTGEAHNMGEGSGSGGMSMGPDMGDGTSPDDTMSMVMTFFTSDSTSLFTKGWTPTTPWAYAGTCAFLVLLAAAMRAVVVLRAVCEETVWSAQDDDRVRGDNDLLLTDSDTEAAGDIKSMAGGGDPPYSNYTPAQRMRQIARSRLSRWRFWTSLSRACIELTLAAIGYLLMLAVMTMNVGYFLSVLAGLFLGTFALGDLAISDPKNESSHC